MKVKFYAWLAGILPRKLVYAAMIRGTVHGTTGRYSSQVVPDLTCMKALERWDYDGR
jgi:hypothetical protein